MDIRQIYWHTSEQVGEDPFRYCPLCGGPLSVEAVGCRSRRACHNCGYTHYRNPAPTVSLLIVEESQVLLGIRTANPGKGRWATPSGYIEFGEDFLTTAAREAKEETGLDIEPAAILNVTDSFFPPGQHFFNVYLLARVTGGQLQAGDDMGELRWFPLAGPLPEMAFQEDIDMIERYRQPGCSCLPIEQDG